MLKLVPLFAAQPDKVFRRSLFSKRLERSQLKFFAEAFFQKGRKVFFPAILKKRGTEYQNKRRQAGWT
ncbi:hypothetical protein ANACOL_01024 [Anaerotruncus colihominis DSM 17241]|uniref:Uncharacterized protein n=1 Tax=Anaerotruncus colihominis DSM 17241 TaxID=445972 RepID=B0P8D5_9FIRM|nr:hypothetical protein ANACOL_01024 [Anaerotruncus colihominis DSM 17241]